LLALADCSTAREPECEGLRLPCTGSVSSYEVFAANQTSSSPSTPATATCFGRRATPARWKPTAATVDPFGNIIIASVGSEVAFGARSLLPDHGVNKAAFVLKLRPDGSEL